MDIVKEFKELQEIGKAKRFTWDYRRMMLRRMAIQEGKLDNFLGWATAHESLIFGSNEYSINEYAALDAKHAVASVDPMIGNPSPTMLPSGSSGTYVRQAYAAQFLSEKMGIDEPEWGSVFEFGGGYGVLANVLSRLGFRSTHAIYDFPELHLLQKWYLYKAGIQIPWQITSINDTMHMDIFIAICSLDEAPPETRHKILSSVRADTYLLWYNFSSLDGEPWFEDWFRNEDVHMDYLPLPRSTSFIQRALVVTRNE
jgi:hypothetical protein